MGFKALVSLHPAIQATELLTFTLAGLTPAEHTSLSWTHNRTCGFPASGSRTRPYAFAHGRSRVRSVQSYQPQPFVQELVRELPRSLAALLLVFSSQPLTKPPSGAGRSLVFTAPPRPLGGGAPVQRCPCGKADKPTGKAARLRKWRYPAHFCHLAVVTLLTVPISCDHAGLLFDENGASIGQKLLADCSGF